MPYAPTELGLMILHGLCGTSIVISGLGALLSPKGGKLHRNCGRAFPVLLCLMAGVILATMLLAPRLVTSLGAVYTVFACYLALTSWTTVRVPPSTLDRFSYAAPVFAVLVGTASVVLGVMASAGHGMVRSDTPIAAFFVFGGLAFLAGWGDLSVVRQGGTAGARRLVRHLWRMCFVLYLSVATLFTGPGSVIFPASIRGSLVMSLPELSILALTAYWLFKVWRGTRASPVSAA